MAVHCQIPSWAEPRPEIGRGVYRITSEPGEHKHTYHAFCPWSDDAQLMLMLRYRRTEPEAEVCVLDLAGGQMSVIGTTTNWNDHTTAGQQWIAGGPRVLYNDRLEDEARLVMADIEGNRTDFGGQVEGGAASPDGRWYIGRTPLAESFPDDGMADRATTGVMRLNLDTGETDLLVPAEEAIRVHPRGEQIRPRHLYAKQFKFQPRTGRFFFMFGTGSLSRYYDEAHTHNLYTAQPDGSEVRCLGTPSDHPMWHPTKELILANVWAPGGRKRLGLFDAKEGFIDHLGEFEGGGHPSFDPAGRLIVTDHRWQEDGQGKSRLRLFLLDEGREIVPAVFANPGWRKSFHTALRGRGEGETVIAALARMQQVKSTIMVTEPHPAWSPDGRLIVFNSDAEQGCQLYLLDLEEALG